MPLCESADSVVRRIAPQSEAIRCHLSSNADKASSPRPRGWRSSSTRDRGHDQGLAHGPSRAPARARGRDRAAVLQSLGLRSFLPQYRPVRGCGRTTRRSSRRWPADPGLSQAQMPVWRETHPGAEDLRVAVMGCVVNGPGRVEACRPSDQPAGHVRGTRRPGVHRWPPRCTVAGRTASSRSHRHPRGLRRRVAPRTRSKRARSVTRAG